MEMQVGVRRGGTFAGRVIRPRRRREAEGAVGRGGGEDDTTDQARRGKKRKEGEEKGGQTLSHETEGGGHSWQREETEKALKGPGGNRVEEKRVGVGVGAWGRQPQPPAPLPGVRQFSLGLHGHG